MIASSKWICAGTLALAALSGCKKSDTAAAPTAPAANANPEIGKVTEDAFYVIARKSDDYAQITHRSDVSNIAYSSACSISASQVGNGQTPDYQCIVESEELDLWYWGTNLQVNVPSTMCDYFQFTPPSYYNYPVGPAPTSVVYDIVDGSFHDRTNSSNGDPYCPFDYSKADPAAPNCCQGEYTATVTTEDSGLRSTVQTNAQWGGNFANCVQGPAMTDWKYKDTVTGMPMTMIYYVRGSGLNKALQISAPGVVTHSFAGGMGYNIYAANYFLPTGTVPRAIDQSLNVDTVPAKPTTDTFAGITNANYSLSSLQNNPWFDYQCLDRNKEVKARIRLMVRSWDKAGMLGVIGQTYGNPTSGTEPVYGGPIHDMRIWNDFITQQSTSGHTWTSGYPMTPHNQGSSIPSDGGDAGAF